VARQILVGKSVATQILVGQSVATQILIGRRARRINLRAENIKLVTALAAVEKQEKLVSIQSE
jgi:hypothetical protein